MSSSLRPLAPRALIVLALFLAACESSSGTPTDGHVPDARPADSTLPADTHPAPTDGAPQEAMVPGDRWSTTFGASGTLHIAAVAGDGAGGATVVGSFEGTLNLGGGPLVSAGGTDIFIAAFDDGGAHRFSSRLGSDGQDAALALAVGPQGEIYVGGSFERSVSFGLATHTAVALTDAFVASFGHDGTPRWSTSFGGTWTDEVHALAVTSTGLALAGNFGAKFQLGATALDAAGDNDVIIASLDDGGVAQWARQLGGRLYDSAHALAVLPGGAVVVGGEFRESLTFSGHELTTHGDADAFVLAVDASGNLSWLQGLGGAGHDRLLALAGAAGGVVVAGAFDQAMTLGASPLTPVGGRDLFVARLDAQSGVVSWARSAGAIGDDEGYALAALGDHVVLGGVASGTLTLDSVVLNAQGQRDGFLLALDAAGSATWGQLLGSAGNDDVSALGQTNGLLLAGGALGGTIDVGGELLSGPSTANAFLLAYPLP